MDENRDPLPHGFHSPRSSRTRLAISSLRSFVALENVIAIAPHYVSALIEDRLRLLASNAQTPVNLGNPDERTIHALAEEVIELVGSESDITYEPLPPQDPTVRRPDITKARTELDWSPIVSLDDGLRNSIEYFEEIL